MKSITLNKKQAKHLSKRLAFCLAATAERDIRTYFTVVFLTIQENDVWAIATDGYSLHVVGDPNEIPGSLVSLNRSAVKTLMAELKAMPDMFEAQLTVEDESIRLTHPEKTVVLRARTNKQLVPPDFAKVIAMSPGDRTGRVCVDGRRIAASMRLIHAAASSRPLETCVSVGFGCPESPIRLSTPGLFAMVMPIREEGAL